MNDIPRPGSMYETIFMHFTRDMWDTRHGMFRGLSLAYKTLKFECFEAECARLLKAGLIERKPDHWSNKGANLYRLSEAGALVQPKPRRNLHKYVKPLEHRYIQ